MYVEQDMEALHVKFVKLDSTKIKQELTTVPHVAQEKLQSQQDQLHLETVSCLYFSQAISTTFTTL